MSIGDILGNIIVGIVAFGIIFRIIQAHFFNS